VAFLHLPTYLPPWEGITPDSAAVARTTGFSLPRGHTGYNHSLGGKLRDMYTERTLRLRIRKDFIQVVDGLPKSPTKFYFKKLM
jgi:hypothetical protein